MLPDNYTLFERHQEQEERWLRKRPICSVCGEHIQDEQAYKLEGDLMCEQCFEEWANGLKVWVEEEEG